MGSFATTRWSLVVASCGDSADARAALDALCSAYRAPILAFVRRHGHAKQEAEDLVQAFFLALIEHRYQAAADPARGPFRTFLLLALKRFLSKAAAREHAVKRGGGRDFVAYDGDEAPTGGAAAAAESPEAAFDRYWALTVLNRALARLEHEAGQAGKAELFERLRVHVADGAEAHDYDADARALGVAPNTVAVAVYRLRKRLREIVREELADTVSDAKHLDDELGSLRAALGGAV
ncbi:MAG TPA: sigma factor [Candidatus Saccharimonadia bacterium]|nr:sigma factor [Candidatus Saccharimonadia bacterium]